MSETMGQIIRRLRKERNLTQEELAEQLNVTFQAVSRWENGTGMPDISQIVPLANVFGVTTDVLFGKDGTDGDEAIEAFISVTEKKICNLPEGISSFAWEKECCEDVQKMLEVHPNNYKLLAYSLRHICCLLEEYNHSNEMGDKTEEIQNWQCECIRQANVILNHCTDSRYLNLANDWMAQLYCDMGNYVKAKEHAEKINVFNPYSEGGDWMAAIYHHLGKKEESRKQYAENICKAFQYLESQFYCIGCSWEEEGKYEEASACFRLYPDIYDIMVGKEYELPFCLKPPYEECARHCMKLDRPDEAMDWLEKMVRHQRLMEMNYNVITESKLPYLYGKNMHYLANSYRRTDTLLPIPAWNSFDPIRYTDRFKAILADAEAFERGE